MKTIAIIEDDQPIGDLLEEALGQAGYATLRAYSGTEAQYLLERAKPDLILLDLMLPGLTGEELLPCLGEIPVIVVSAKVGVDDKVNALLTGAADYVSKPFAMRELMARVKANIRRMDMAPVQSAPPTEEKGKRLDLGRVAIDLDGATVFKDGKPLDLTQREYELICFLASQPGKVFSREALMEHVWNYEGYVGDVRAVDVAVRRLREKLEDDPAAPKFILTKRGMGYLFSGQPS